MMKKRYYLKTALILIITAISALTACEDKEMGTPLPAPVADFSYTSDNQFLAPTTVSFSNKSILATGFGWDFGNGETSTQENPATTYTEPGIYQVKLIVNTTHDVYYNRKEKVLSLVIKDPQAATVPRLYYTDRNTGKAHFVYLDGSDPTIQDFQGGGFFKPYGIVANKSNNKVYITDTDGFIFGFNLDGENQEFILREAQEPLAAEPYGIVAIGDEIYWATYGETGGIAKANLDGSEPQSVVQFAGAPELPLGIAYDSIAGEIYLANDMYDFSGGIWKIKPDGTELQEVLPGVDAGAIALDLINGRMYFADYIGGIKSAKLDGSDVVVLDPDLDQKFVWGIAINPEEGKVYVADKNSNRILRMNLDGSNPEDWITGIEPYAMYVFDPLN
jgi:DNA-binding beta-propeller fold protein YncE